MTEPIDIREEAEARREEAKRHFEAIKSAGVTNSRSSLSIGFHARILKEKNLWGMLGFRDEDETREASGVGSSTWYSTIAIAESFKGVPEEQFTLMKLSNANAARDLPDSKRVDPEWIRRAIELSMKEFQKLLEEELYGKAKRSDSVEQVTTMKMAVPASQKKVIEKRVEAFAEKHGMDPKDTGSVIEAALVESTEGDTLLAVLLRVVGRAKQIKELLESGLSSDEILAKVIVINEETVLDVHNAIKGTGVQEEAA